MLNHTYLYTHSLFYSSIHLIFSIYFRVNYRNIRLSLNNSACLSLTVIQDYFFFFWGKIYVQRSAQILSVHWLSLDKYIHLTKKTLTPPERTTVFISFPHRLVLPVLEFHKNGNSQYILLLWKVSLTQHFFFFFSFIRAVTSISNFLLNTVE